MKRIISILLAISVSVSAMAQASIRDAMAMAADRYGVSFVYDTSLPVNAPSHVDALKKSRMEDALDALFNGSGILWERNGKYIVLKRAKPSDQHHDIAPADAEDYGQMDVQMDTITASKITGVIDRDMNFTQTGLAKLDGAVFHQGYAAVSVPDLVKTLQTLPGVAAGTELLSGLYVHGGDSSDNLYLIEGVPVYQISHLGGIFSTFNTDAVDHVDFYRSGFPARFGGRTSSVVDVSLKDGDFSTFSGQWSLGLMEGRLTMNGPIVPGRTSFAMSARRSWADAVIYPVLGIMNAQSKDRGESLNAGYAFMDLTAKLTHKISEGSIISAFLFLGNDAFRFKQTLDRDSTDGDASISSKTIDGADMSWGNSIASVKWDRTFSQDLSLRAVGFWSDAHSRIGTGSSYIRDSQISDYGLDGGYVYENKAFNCGDVDDSGFSADIDWHACESHHIRSGANFTFHKYSPQSKFDFVESGQAVSRKDAGLWTVPSKAGTRWS